MGSITKVLRLTIPGDPMGKPRMTRKDKWAKRDCVVRYRAWADAARLVLKSRGGIPDGAVIREVSWVAYFQVTPSWSKKKQAEMLGQPHRHTPDRDNIDKALLDAIFKGGDQHVTSGRIHKEWAEAGKLYVEITYDVPGDNLSPEGQ